MKVVEERGEMAVGARTDEVPGEIRMGPAPHKNIKHVRLYEITTPYFGERNEEHEPLLMVRDNQK